MSMSGLADVRAVLPQLQALRELGVSEVRVGSEGIVVCFWPPAPAASATASPSPSTPEQPGNAGLTESEPPKKDIFDVLADGQIPGAPSRDGLAGTPGSG